MKFLALIAACFAATPIVQGPLQNCGTPTDGIELFELITGPDPVVAGQQLSIKLSGNVKQEIVQGSQVQVTVRLGVLQVFNQNFDLCEQEKATNPCPMVAGTR
jgi:hypothetical protein